MGVFSGDLISVSPTTIKYGRPIDLVAKWTVSTSSAWEVINGWWADIEITLDGMGGKADSGIIIGYSKKTFTHMINISPDVMPGYNIDGYATIKCYKGGFSSDYEVVYNQPITIRVEGIPNGPEEEEEGFPIIPVALAAGCLLVITAAATKNKK